MCFIYMDGFMNCHVKKGGEGWGESWNMRFLRDFHD